MEKHELCYSDVCCFLMSRKEIQKLTELMCLSCGDSMEGSLQGEPFLEMVPIGKKRRKIHFLRYPQSPVSNWPFHLQAVSLSSPVAA